MENDDTLSYFLQKWSEHTIHQSMHGFMHFMRAHDISYSQISVLYRIYHHGPTDIKSLSCELQISKAGAGQLVDRMIQSGWLNSQTSSTDKRSKIITLTKEGKELVLSSQVASMDWVDEFVNRIPEQSIPDITTGIMSLIENLHSKQTIRD